MWCNGIAEIKSHQNKFMKKSEIAHSQIDLQLEFAARNQKFFKVGDTSLEGTLIAATYIW